MTLELLWAACATVYICHTRLSICCPAITHPAPSSFRTGYYSLTPYILATKLFALISEHSFYSTLQIRRILISYKFTLRTCVSLVRWKRQENVSNFWSLGISLRVVLFGAPYYIHSLYVSLSFLVLLQEKQVDEMLPERIKMPYWVTMGFVELQGSLELCDSIIEKQNKLLIFQVFLQLLFSSV